MRGLPSFWQNQTVDPPIPWEEWNDLFQLAIIAKENVDIEKLLNSIKRPNPHPSTPDNLTEREKRKTREKNE